MKMGSDWPVMAIMHNPSQRAPNFRLADNTLGAHGVASSSNSARAGPTCEHHRNRAGEVVLLLGMNPRAGEHLLRKIRSYTKVWIQWAGSKTRVSLGGEKESNVYKRHNWAA
jgi:hypothetical protein